MRKASLKLLWLLLVSTSCFAQNQQSIRNDFFGGTDVVEAQVDDLHAKLLAPETYAAAIAVTAPAGASNVLVPSRHAPGAGR